MADGLLSFLDLHPFVRSTVVDKVRGVIFGGALGDAVGLYTEFLPKTQASQLYANQTISFLDPVTPLHEDTHRDRFHAKAWTDDTDHAILLLLSYLHTDGEFSIVDFAQRLRSWGSGQGLRCLDRLPLGIGRTVSSVLGRPGFDVHPKKASEEIWKKSGCNIAPNGSLMRTNVLGVVGIGKTLEETWKMAMEFSLVTHYDPRCVVSCCAYTALIRGILRHEVTSEADVDGLLESSWVWVNTQKSTIWPDQVLDTTEYQKHINVKTLDELKLDDARGMGYVYKAFGCAIFTLRRAFRESNDPVHDLFGELIMSLVLQGGDADTNACIAGGLLGAFFGYNALTPRWRDGLAHRQWLMSKTMGLMETVGLLPGEYRGSEDPDTALDGGKGFLSKQQMDERERDLTFTLLTEMKKRKDKQDAEERAKNSFWGRLKG
ncbi:ADP-ribosylglycohydrolase [Ascodesmis nigricans]|uniref:ADP-ribosylglycohydrolase n=1 Tax=Ascodesmis nigricans TaxID=341454 RepID=A0A4S2N4D0_9PEZI|nr:ADP-ribosylglycohydrolase [Ascodesmis nigricans]